MEDKYLKILEFPKILSQLAQYTSFSAGRDLALSLHPSTKPEAIERALQMTTEARQLQEVKTNLSLRGARDVRPLLEKSELHAILLPQELLDIRGTLNSARTLRNTLTRLKDQFPLLGERAEWIAPCPKVAEEIARCINENRIVVEDNASPQLAKIRRDLQITRDRLMDKLNRIISSSGSAGFLQDALITERSGRYVIPVRVEAKGRIEGVVHDQSASGATVFVEPLATVGLNNQLRQLELAEEREIERILRELTALVEMHHEEIERDVEILAELDLAFAKARYAAALEATAPIVTNEPSRKRRRRIKGRWRTIRDNNKRTLALKKARHPLLDPQTVVPIDVFIENDYRILVVTGPNTGGKTVSLKTVGLLVLMAQSGLHIPADEGSSLPLFDAVFADIGDEQSIEQSLSTFSSHISNIIVILEKATARSLVLLDEVGVGTDPEEGAALAQALLHHFLKRGVMGIVTTHYSALKIYAHDTAGLQNAHVEFDPETLAPTYHLVIGLPGRSNALAIASRLGMSEEIIRTARQWVSTEELEVDSLLDTIKRTRDAAEEELQSAQIQRLEAETQTREVRNYMREMERERAEIMRRARVEVMSELEGMQEELSRIRTKLKTNNITAEWARRAADSVHTMHKELAIQEEEIEAPVFVAPGSLQIGDRVQVDSLGQQGDLVAIDEGTAEVQVGSFRVEVHVNDLDRIERPTESPEESEAYTTPAALQKESPGIEIDLRGWRAADVPPKIDKYLDDAHLAGLPYVRIIHGKGTGTLRQVVRDFLHDHPLVSEYQAGEEREGGEGVTVARIVS